MRKETIQQKKSCKCGTKVRVGNQMYRLMFFEESPHGDFYSDPHRYDLFDDCFEELDFDEKRQSYVTDISGFVRIVNKEFPYRMKYDVSGCSSTYSVQIRNMTGNYTYWLTVNRYGICWHET